MTNHSDVPFRKRPRQRYTIDFKRRAVEQTLQANTSAASVALLHGINANLLLRWRKEYELGDFGPVTRSSFVQVELATSAIALPKPKDSSLFTKDNQIDVIEILFDEIKMCVHGRPDAYILRTIIEVLRT